MKYIIKRYKKRKNKTRKTYLKKHPRKSQKGGFWWLFPLLK